jgi:hypothetical protein
MLTIVCQYIDAQCSEDAFLDFVEEMARTEIDTDDIDEL